MKKNHNFDLVLKCVVFATELMKFANEFVAFLNTVLNYPFDNATQMVYQVRTKAW